MKFKIKDKDTIALAISAIASFNTTRGMYREWKDAYENKHCHRATVNSDSYIYRYMMEWLDEETNSNKVILESTASGIRRQYDSNYENTIYLEGYPIKVSADESSPNTTGDLFAAAKGKKSVTFTSRSKEGMNALERKLSEITEDTKRKIRQNFVWSPSTYDDWNSHYFNPRPLESVILPRGVKESVVDDLELFLNSKDQYAKIGAPWHRGYILYGEPGNGKSSLVSAIAQHYSMDLYSMPLSLIKDDKHLMECITAIKVNSILLIEDIDVFSGAVTREGNEGGPTLAGLLNCLDGVHTPSGLITFMTTNNLDKLDSALIRPGRADVKIELKAPVPSQVNDMFSYVYGEPLGVEPREFNSMSELSEIFKSNLTDPEGARVQIKDNNLLTEDSRKPCKGKNANICVGEGCYGEACLR